MGKEFSKKFRKPIKMKVLLFAFLMVPMVFAIDDDVDEIDVEAVKRCPKGTTITECGQMMGLGKRLEAVKRCPKGTTITECDQMMGLGKRLVDAVKRICEHVSNHECTVLNQM